MQDNDTKRLTRITTILTWLQSKKIITAKSLAEKFSVSVRTIYRDIKVLEQAGVPVLMEEGKGYTLMEGYRIPPVMFTESEANALITAEQLIATNKDMSLVKEYTEAVNKVKAVLGFDTKNKTEFLSQRIFSLQNWTQQRTSSHLTALQMALTNFRLAKLEYQAAEKVETTVRIIEPFSFYYSTQENWLVIAFCRLRKEFRTFRLDRIQSLDILSETFEPHAMTIKEYYEIWKKKEKETYNP